MPIRAYCTICSDFFDHYKDVSAIHCGHTFHNECLLQWFQTAPTKTCPQCRKHVSTRHIISKLFFDVGGEEDSSAVDPERLQNELDRVKALLTTKEKDMRDKQKMAEALRETVEKQKLNLESARKMVDEKDKLCSALRKQMKYLEIQQSETQHAKEEAQRLRVKMKTYESLDLVLHGQQAEVEAMISDMGVGQSAVHQLSIYCISLKKEYENLKSSHRSSNEMCEKLRRELLATNNKLQKSTLELNRSKEETKAIQQDLRNSDKEITSLKKKIEILQKTLSTPTRTNEALSRLILESPAPRELKQHNNEDIDLNLTFDVSTPEPVLVPTKMTCLEPTDVSPSNHPESAPSGRKRTYVQDKDVLQEPCLRDSILFKKKTFASMLDPHRSRVGAVRMGYDGLGGRMRFIQPSPLSEIRPLAMKAKRKKVSRPPPRQQLTLDALCG